jgi:uncharacterized membrane protein
LDFPVNTKDARMRHGAIYTVAHGRPSGSAKRVWFTFARRGIICAAALGIFQLFNPNPAAADFRVCNNTANRIRVAIGYKDASDWTTKGWWNLGPNKCDALLTGKLTARYFYVRAAEQNNGSEWGGKAFLCTSPGEFTIQGTQQCSARGYDRSGFTEVDTQDRPDWTVQLYPEKPN